MTNLFILYYNLDVGGIQKKIVDITNYLKENRPNVKIRLLLRNCHENDFFSNQIPLDNTIVEKYPKNNKSIMPFGYFRWVILTAWRYKPLAILAFSDMPALCAIGIKFTQFWRGISVVIGEDWSIFPEERTRNYKNPQLRRLMIAIFYHFADRIFCVSKVMKMEMSRYYGLKKNVQTIDNWVMPLVVTKKTSKIYDLIYVGRFEAVKKLDLLITAVSQLKKRRPGIRLCLVGTGTQEVILHRSVKKDSLTSNVIFVKTNQNVYDYLLKAKVYVQCSDSEGLPLSVLEAMAASLPVVVSNYTGVEDLIQEGINGVTFNKNDLGDLCNKINLLLDDDKYRDRLGIAATEYVRSKHSYRNIEQYLKSLGV